jgi:acyl-CoA thioester hydrolase
LPVAVEHRVNFYDTDAMEVVHHANYIRWFEIGRVAYLRQYHITLADMMEDGYVFPITKVEAQYLSPGRFDDVLVIETTATALTKAKMSFAYRILRKGTDEVLVTGRSQNVFTKRDTGHITRLPEKYYSVFAQAMEDERAAKAGNA